MYRTNSTEIWKTIELKQSIISLDCFSTVDFALLLLQLKEIFQRL